MGIVQQERFFLFLTRISQKTRNSFIADFSLSQIAQISQKALALRVPAVRRYTQAVARVFREICEICVRHIIYRICIRVFDFIPSLSPSGVDLKVREIRVRQELASNLRYARLMAVFHSETL